MPSGLENKVGENAAGPYRSQGEKRIAATLDQYGIPFVYEQRVRIQYNGRTQTLRPDFYLPGFNLYIEYYGRVGNQDYDLRTANKNAAYAANNINVLSVYPWDLIQDWPNYLLERLRNLSVQYSETKSTGRPTSHSPISYRQPKPKDTRPYIHIARRPYI